ncbi:YicC/YloC family endoribonuclease [Andreprevotia chitinilytica]|uniref:YicC/YloC family endoribonuclease n=1 Tax=Andreprevotia chitinilytica TaxID=396808 RepID=UPI00054DAE1B|nr:YicC/YloC family endoribonuclease [Andreprevotia chitinilytica]
MIFSMTGYAIAQRELPGGTLSVELRAVNHRFLDLTLRLPEELRALEGTIREKVGGTVSRGKVECRINFNVQAGLAGKLELNRELLQQLLAVAQEAQALAPSGGELKLGELLRWPGVLSQETPEAESLQAAALELLEVAIADFNASRGREGEKLKAHLSDRVAGMEALITDIKPRVPQLVSDYEAKIKARLLEALGTLDDERVRQEIVLFAQKVDVDEELTRLITHLDEVRRILKKGGATGKRLDFLMQELNREANTLGSKAAAVESARTSIELKVLIEQMREQIQNIE